MIPKKGISPLIATVLLIGFTVALAAVIMTWGLDYVKSTTKNVGDTTQQALLCSSKLNFDIRDVDCTLGTLNVYNEGEVEITELTLRVYQIAGTTVQTINQSLPVFGAITVVIDGGTLAGVQKIDAQAAIKTKEGTVVLCSGNYAKSFEIMC